MTGLFDDDQAQGGGQPYRVLARKYRPSTLGELIGQEAMVRTLRRAFQSGRLPQAWILTGVRGIGKTTTARIIAKALNCAGRAPGADDIEPCGKCEACRAIAEDRYVDVQEMDAASRTGVDDIREIIEGVRYGPVSAKYKVYILDEVHMLSKNAFNALLKTLEEPPPHTKFIFATTEIRKVPVTVLSRCQRFDLRRIDAATLAAHYARIAALENVETEEEAIKLIARAADGSVRDGLSLLDQAIARGQGKVGEADVKDMLGLADRNASFGLCRRLLRGEMREALAGFEAMQQVGADPVQILQDLADSIHLLTRAQVVSDGGGLREAPEAEKKFVSEMGDVKVPALTRAWQILLKGIEEVLSAPQPAKAAEMVLIRLAYAAELPLPGDLIKQLREQSRSSVAAETAPSGPPPSGPALRARSGAAPLAVAPPASFTAISAAAPAPQTFRELACLFAVHREAGLYAELVAHVRPVRFAPGRLEVQLESGASLNLVSRVSQCLSDWTGRRWVVAVASEPGGATLQEEDREAERQRQERARAHPLMQAVKKAFPDMKLVSLKKKETPLAAGEEVLEAPPEAEETDD